MNGKTTIINETFFKYREITKRKKEEILVNYNHHLNLLNVVLQQEGIIIDKKEMEIMVATKKLPSYSSYDTNLSSCTSLQLALKFGLMETIPKLLDMGGCELVWKKDECGRTALHYVCEYTNPPH